MENKISELASSPEIILDETKIEEYKLLKEKCDYVIKKIKIRKSRRKNGKREAA
jgi:hypothetical protein